MSAVFLPFHNAQVDWDAFVGLVGRTVEAGLVPAVNMDTGFVDLLDPRTRAEVLRRTAEVAQTRFVAGAFVADRPGATFDLSAHAGALDDIQTLGGTPVVFPSHGLRSLTEDGAIAAHDELAKRCDRFIAFELGEMFASAGRVYSLSAWRGLLDIRACVGAKHSSLSRELEWERSRLRDQVRPDFLVLSGNDLAIDMVMYGSDYLLGLSTFAPDVFGRRDALWEAGDPAFFELNDRLQLLGGFAFRPPVTGYKASAAHFLHLRGWVGPDASHPGAKRRPDSDVETLRTLGQQLGVLA
jgi:hypothetical protein